MATWKDFIRFVQPDVPGCPKTTVVNAIRDSAIRFAELTRIWSKDSVLADVIAGQATYSFAPGTDAAVVTVDYAELDGQVLAPVTKNDLNEWTPNWRSIEESRPTRFFMETPEAMRLVGTPTEDVSGGLLVDVVLKPSRVADSCPDFFLEDWAETIAAGAKASLQKTPAKPWTELSLSQLNHREFRRGVSTARSREAKGGMTMGRTIQPQPFGGIVI